MKDNVLLRWSDNIEIDNIGLRGVTSASKSLTKPPYFNKPCKLSNDFAPVGLRLPVAIHKRDNINNLGNVGARISNVHFVNFDHDDDCQPSIPFAFYSGDDHGKNHFSYLTMIQNITVDGTGLIDAESGEEDGINNVIIHDIDGSSSPPEIASSGPGMFVRDVLWLRAFVRDTCKPFPRGISYCPNSCYRTMTVFVDQTDSEGIDIRVTRVTDYVEALVPYNQYDFDDNIHRKHCNNNLRGYSFSLPAGEYIVEFLQDLQISWPKFALPQLDGSPDCNGYMSEENITLIELDGKLSLCDNLIVNGDMEQGTYSWYHRNSHSNTKYGELLAVEGQGIDGSAALRYYNRSSYYAGIGQHLDMRCIHSNSNGFYEIEMYFRLENGTTAFICDRWSSSWSVRCPFITFQEQKLVNETLRTAHTHHRASVVVPNNRGDLNLVHGVFRVDEQIHSLQRIFMYLEYTHTDYDMIIDNTSVTKLAGICGTDLMRNGNFDDFGKYLVFFFLKPYFNMAPPFLTFIMMSTHIL